MLGFGVINMQPAGTAIIAACGLQSYCLKKCAMLIYVSQCPTTVVRKMTKLKKHVSLSGVEDKCFRLRKCLLRLRSA